MNKILSIVLLLGFGHALNACEFNALLREKNISHKKRTARVKRDITVYGKFDQAAVFPDGEISSKKLIIDSNVTEPITQERFGRLDGRNLIVIKYRSNGMFYYRVYSASSLSYRWRLGDLDLISRQPIIEIINATKTHRSRGYRVRNTHRFVDGSDFTETSWNCGNQVRNNDLVIEDGNSGRVQECLESCACLVCAWILAVGMIVPAYLVSAGAI